MTWYTLPQTLELALMLIWALAAAASGILLALPNSVHPTRHCLTQCSYLAFTYAGTCGLFGYHLMAFVLLFIGGVLYTIRYRTVKLKRHSGKERRTLSM